MPTNKQKRAAEIFQKNPEKPFTGENGILKQAGYAQHTDPKDLTTSKGWKELMDQYWPDDKLIEVGQQGLEATRTISAVTGNKANGGTVDFVDVPDWDVRHKFFNSITKLKDKEPKQPLPGSDASAPLHISWIKPDEEDLS